MSDREAKSVEWATNVQQSRAGGVFYWFAVRFFRLTLMPWLRVKKEGVEHLDLDGLSLRADAGPTIGAEPISQANDMDTPQSQHNNTPCLAP